jgi:hypothetical protein
MDQPLEPGTYYVGIYNNTASTIASTLVDSRGIGSGQTYPVTTLDYAGGNCPDQRLGPTRSPLF